MSEELPLSESEREEARAMVSAGKAISEVAEWLGCHPRQVRSAVAPVVQRERTSVGLRDILFDEIERLRRGETTPAEASAISGLSKQIISVSKLEMDYAKQRSGGQCEKIETLTLGSAAVAVAPATEASSDTTNDTRESSQ